MSVVYQDAFAPGIDGVCSIEVSLLTTLLNERCDATGDPCLGSHNACLLRCFAVQWPECGISYVKSYPHGSIVQALEYQMQQGMAEGGQQQVFLMPRSAAHTYGPPLQSACCLLRLLAGEQ